jgi:hypothetical protein
MSANRRYQTVCGGAIARQCEQHSRVQCEQRELQCEYDNDFFNPPQFPRPPRDLEYSLHIASNQIARISLISTYVVSYIIIQGTPGRQARLASSIHDSTSYYARLSALTIVATCMQRAPRKLHYLKCTRCRRDRQKVS